MDNCVIKVSHVSKSYKLYDKPFDRLKEAWSFNKNYHRDYFALNDITFDINKGECVGIVGTNGAGKSTLLKIITGVLHPTEGTLTVNGKISALLELGTGFNMEYTGLKNIYLNGTMMGYTKEEMDQKVPNIIEFAEIGDFINQPVKSYSSGMFARLAFAVAINVEPDILIVDEALSVGDIFFQAKCFKKFTEFQEKGKTILFVSHDLSSVIKYCDRCILIHKGKQIAAGPTTDVVNTYRKILVQGSKEKDTEKEADPIAETKENSVNDKLDSQNERLWKDSLLINKNFVEYGNGRAHIIDFAIVDDQGNVSSSIMKGSEYEIRIKVKFHEHIDNPIFAYTIKDIKGTDITGTNTVLENNNITSAEEDQVVTACFKQKMLLQGGQYILSIACTGYEGDKFVVHHRLYDICSIQVISERNTIGFFDSYSSVRYL